MIERERGEGRRRKGGECRGAKSRCQRGEFSRVGGWIGAGKGNRGRGAGARLGDSVNHKRKRCAPACRRQCTPLLLFERITMDHVGETGLMVSGWDVPRTEPVVPSRTFYAPPFRPPLFAPRSTSAMKFSSDAPPLLPTSRWSIGSVL